MRIGWKSALLLVLWIGGSPISAMAEEPSASIQKSSEGAPKEHVVKDATEKFLKQHELYQQYQRPTDLETLRALAKERRAHMEKLIEEDPQAFLDQAFSEDIRKKIPPEISEDIEALVTTEGMLEVYIEDYFDENPPRSRTLYQLRDRQGKRWNLHFVRPRHDFISGIYLNVQGTGIGQHIAIDNEEDP